jgi:hypothetical protein
VLGKWVIFREFRCLALKLIDNFSQWEHFQEAIALVEPYPEEPDLKELISEHEALRREILHNETVVMQTVTSTIAIVSAMMGFAFSEFVKNLTVKSFLFFAAESLVIIAMMQSLDKVRLTYLIASYLRVFTETKLHHLKWETRLSEFRKFQPKKGHRGLIDNQLWVYSFIALINFACGAFYVVQSYPSSQIAIFLLACGLILTMYLIVNARINCNKYVYRHVETFESVWTGVRAREEQAIHALNERMLMPTAPLNRRFHRLRRFFRL